jgi:hypothetical protein
MNLTEITLTAEEEYGAQCLAEERNERDRQSHKNSLERSNGAALQEYRDADHLAQAAHRDANRLASLAHEGEDPFVPTEYVHADPFVPDETPFEPRSIEDAAQDAVREMLARCAERAHHKEVADIGQSVMALAHAARRDAIDALTDSQD